MERAFFQHNYINSFVMNNRILLLAFLLLLSVYFIVQTCGGKRRGSFDANLIELDTSRISSIMIQPREPESPEILLKREETGWIVSNSALNTRATPASVTGLLTSIQLIRTQRVAAKSPDKWRDFEVEDGMGTRIRVFEGDQKKADFMVGRFSFNPQTQSGVSYIRLEGSDEVYAIEGFQLLSIGQGLDAYRDKTLLRLNSDMQVEELSFEYPDSAFAIRRGEKGWLLNGAMALDSARVEDYINFLRNVSGSTFADDFDETTAASLPRQTIRLKGPNIDPPFVIQVYRDTTRERPFVIHSSQNPSAWFDSDSTGVYLRLVKVLPDDFIEQGQ